MSFSADIKEEMAEMKKSIQKIQSESFAYEMMKDEKKDKIMWRRAWFITFIAFIMLGTYTIYLLNDITVVENTEETYDIEQNSGDNGNNNFINGNDNEVHN